MPRRLYDFIYSSVYFAIREFMGSKRGERKETIGPYAVAYLIEQAARDAVDDALNVRKS